MLEIKNLSKSYETLKVLDNIQLKVKKGEIVAIMGPNGCGKTTLLNIISKTEKQYDGKIISDEKPSIVFQHPSNSTIPWKNVWDNILLDKKDKQIQKKTIKLLKETNLWNKRNKYPYELSGGMRQLVAIIRCLVHERNLILLDEPFSSLDIVMTQQIRGEIINLWKKHKPTIILVTHYLDDALAMADKIILLSKQPGKINKIIQIKNPRKKHHDEKYNNIFEKYKTIIAYK